MSKNNTKKIGLKYTNILGAERNRDIIEKADEYSRIREKEANIFNIKNYFEKKYFRKNINRLNEKKKKNLYMNIYLI